MKQFSAAVTLLVCLCTTLLHAQIPVLVKDIYPGSGSGINPNSGNPIVNINGTVYFAGTDQTQGSELWKSDGTEAGTVVVKDIYSGSGSSDPHSLIAVNGKLMFYAYDPQVGHCLFKSDGTEAGTVRVKVLNYYYGEPRYLTNVNGTLYFAYNDGSQGDELWKSDGTEAGTVLVKDIHSTGNSSSPTNLINANGTLYFFATDATHGRELWKSDGTDAGTVLVKDIEPGAGSGAYDQLVAVGNRVYFIGAPYVNNYPDYELWKSDGTEAGTMMVKELTLGSNYYNYISDLLPFNGVLYFNYSYGGDQLWKTDGTEAGTVKVFPAQSQGINFNYLTKTGNSLYFFDGSNRLWKSDGTTAGTVLVKTFSGSFGVGTTYNGSPAGVGNILYFQAYQNGTGHELWKSDGTEAGTAMLPEIQPGSEHSYPGSFTDANGTLFFNASTTLYGRELYALKTCQLPVMATQPASGSGVCAGSTVTAAVTATGTGLSYQWYNNQMQPISGAMAATLSLTNVQSSQDGTYRCKVTNSCGSITSDPFSLSVSSPPVINQHPSDQTNCSQTVDQYSSVSFYVGVPGKYLSYQWETRANGSSPWVTLTDETHSSGNQAVSGTNSINLYIYSYSSYFRNGQQFRAKVTTANCPDVVYSNPATLNVIAPIIITQPTDQVVCGGTSAKFKVVTNTNGGGTLTYQWQYSDASYGWHYANATGFSGYDTNELTVSGSQIVNGRQFRAYVSNNICGGFYSSQVALTTGGGITVSAQPTNQTVCSSSNSASFSVAAAASGSIQYRWQWRSGENDGWQDLTDGSGLSGATTTNLTVNSNSFYFRNYSNSQYRVKMTTATGSCPGDLYANPATLTRDNGPVITVSPTYQNYVCAGGTINIAVAATGNGPLTYQWYKFNQTAVSGATSATLTLTNPQPEPGNPDYNGWYVCRVTNNCGTVTSGTAYVYIRSGAPTINSQPTSQTICSTNTYINFYAYASGHDKAQWETRADANAAWIPLTNGMTGISGAEDQGHLYVYATSPYFRVGQQFRLKASTICTTTPVYSNPATLSLYNPVAFTSQPTNQTVCVSTITSFSAAVAPDGRSYSYSWQYNDGPGWVPILGNTPDFQGYNQNQLTVSGTQVVNGRKFRLLATDNTCSSLAYSNEATLQVINGITVTTQPTDQTACSDGSVSFSVVAASSQTVSYQWQWRYGEGYQWQDVTNGSGYAGATTAKLTVTGNALNGGNELRARLQSSACPTPFYTNPAKIITISPPYMYNNPPSSQTVCAGTPVTVTVQAYYNRPGENYVTDNTLIYQWYRNNTIVAGATSATLSIPSPTTASAGEYKAIITNACGSVTSGTFTLYLSEAPSIYSQPNASYEFCPGATSGIQLTALVYGQNLTFQWETRANSTAAWEPTPPNSQTSVGNNGIYKQPYYTVGSDLYQDGRQFRLKAGSTGCPGVTYTNSATISVYKSATFATQPSSQTVCASGATSFSATAVNPYPNNGGFYTYWEYSDGTTWQTASTAGMAGYTTSQLTVSGAAVVNGRRFRMQAYNIYFTCVLAYSSEATITTVDAVAINAHPANQTACSTTGSTSFSVAVAGTGIQYQWETGSGSNWTPLTNTSGISGATTDKLIVGPGTYLTNGRDFRVKLTASTCPTPAYSNAAKLTLFSAPTIYAGPSPTSQTVCAGSQATTFIEATSNLPLTYQWYLGATPVSGATQNSLSISNVQAAQAGAYTAQVANACGTVTSSPYNLSISGAPILTNQPQDLTLCAGSTNNATFSVGANGQTLNYQWQTRANSTAVWVNLIDAVNGQGVTLLTGATTANLNVRPASESYANNQQFRVRIYTVACQQEVFSNSVTLNLRGPVLITAQPTNATVCNEGVASFSVVVNANGTGTPVYQWQYLNNTTWTTIGSDGNGFNGVGTSVLTVSGSGLVNGRKLRVLVYGNQCGANSTVTSAEATLSTVNGIVITGQPASQTVCSTGTVSFMVAATAGEAITYQWESFANNTWAAVTNANGLSGATSATLTATGTALTGGRQFRVKLNTASCASALYSNAATLAVGAPAAVASDLPPSFTVCPTSTAEQIAVTANGTGLAFDWQTRPNNTAAWVTAPIQYVYPNGTSGTRYQFPGNAFPNGQQFRVQITSSVCSATIYSQIATLTLRQAPTITVQPASLTVCTNAPVTFSVAATSNNTGYSPQYDWQYLDGSLWISATGNGFAGQGTNQLTVSGAQVVEGRRFRVVIGDGFGYNCLVTTSNEATLVTGTPVLVTSQPVSQTTLPNSPVSFSVSATAANGTVLYQWESRANTTDAWTVLTNSADVSGATTPILIVTYSLQSNGRQFRVKLSSTSCSTPSYSDVVTLTLKTVDLAVKNVTSDRTSVEPNDVVTVSWSIANDGTASSAVDWSERIYLQSPSGANRTLLKQVTFANSTSLASTQTIPRSETLTIPVQLLTEDQAVFVVEVVPGSSIQEISGAQANNIAVQQTAWTIKKTLALALSASELTEGSATGATATVSRTGSLATSVTITVGISNSSRFSYPTSVVIPAGQSGVSFTLSVPDNNTIEGKTTHQLQVSTSGYQGVQADIAVLDNDAPTLSIINLPASAVEGQTVTFNVTTNLAPSSPLSVFLQSSSSARFPVPASVTIPAGSLSAVVSVTLEQDNIPEIDLAVTVTAGASNHNPAADTIQVKDDDLPNLELVILANNISESAGANATQAVLRRTASSSSIAFTANLSANLSNTLLLPGAISLAEGENEKTFTIGAVDNSLVDGQRLVTVTASLFVSSCGCNAPPASSGSVSATVTVNDDDGPSLKLTVAQQTLSEGFANAGSLRITRNSATTEALSVSLTSSDVTKATLPATTVIPAGQTFVDVAITTVDDGITDGNQTVYFTATASGFSPGSTFVIVTDLNKPDLQIPLVQLTSTKVQAGADITYQVSVRNSGAATAPSGTRVRGYLSTDNVIDASDLLFSEDLLGEAIPAGQTKILSRSVKAPDTQGSYKLLFWANPDATLTELLLTNNVSTPVNLTVEPNYTATAVVGPTYFLQGNTIPVTGSATKLTGSPAANVPVEVYLIMNGIRRTLSDTTDASGNYSIPFLPIVGESGHYSIGASAPGSNQTTTQDEFDILGVRINDGNTLRFEVVQNQTATGVLKVQNLSNKNLTKFTIKPIGLPGGVSMQFGTIAQLGGNATADLTYQIVGSTLSTGDNFTVINFEATANEGVIQKQKLYYYCQAPNAFVVANVTSFETAVSQASKERIVEIKLLNKGKGATGNVTINLPSANWITSVSPKVLPSMMPGDSSFVTLRFLALDEVPFDLPINSSIGVVAQNGNSFTIPFTFRKVAESKGSVSITATNQFTYFTDGHPNVQGAKVRIENYFTGELYAEGITDASGVFNATGVPEGKHRVIAEKEKHKSYNGTIVINPGSQTESTAFLEYQAVTYTWKVVPTTVQDQYGITLETKFETNVPMPVVTIDMPDSVPQLSVGQQYSFNVTLTNHGLITAKDVVLNLPQDDPEYEFITNYITADLVGQQSIQVPVVMRRRSGGGRIGFNGGRQMNPSGELRCRFMAGVNYWYQCALNVIGASTAKPVNYAGSRCGSQNPGGGGPGWTDADIIRYINQYNYWAQIAVAWSEAFRGVFDGGTPGSGPEGTPEPYELPKWMTEKKSCQDCINDIIGVVDDCTPIPLSDIVEVAKCGFDNYHAKGDPLNYVGCLAEPIISGFIEKEIDEVTGEIKDKIKDELPPKIRKIVDAIEELADDVSDIIDRFNCVGSVIKAVTTCLRVEDSPSNLPNSANARKAPAPNGVFKEISSDLQVVSMAYKTQINWNKEYFGEMINADGWAEFYSLARPYIIGLKPFGTNVQAIIITATNGYDISSSTLQSFFNRWNTSIQARSENVLSPTTQYPGIINWTLIKAYSDSLVDNHNYAIAKGLKSVEYMHESSIESLNEIIDGQKDDVCASVSVQFNQQLTMTREAFEGTLEITNGHPTDAMKTIAVNIQITDENGTPSNGLFEIQPQSPANLADINAQQKGSVKFIFIPEVGAAPQVAKVYKFGGNISYLDPYANAVVTLPLAAVAITVNPSPNLMLHYFMERNILGDDALTSPEVEPSVPAELAVMVENKGYGPARDMTISSAQPKIVDNEKGLAINFNLIGSNFQGQPKQFGLTDINFGEIPARQTRIGQWYFTSSLLGKFVSYDAKVVHNSSFGNKDLSLIQGVKLHELTKSIQLYGELEDGITDFLVNDVFDVADIPDIIYFSQGNRTAKVSPATSGSFSAPVSAPTFTNTLTVTPSEAGFNYIKLDDPGNRLFELVSVTRSDGQVIPLNNAWLTFVTLPVSRSPIYENKFHIVDNFASAAPATYTVVWKPKDSNVPKVDSIAGAPAQVSSTQVKNLRVYFNKRIDPATFTYEDLTLTLQGGQNLINSSVIITQLDTAAFNVDLSAVTTGNGLYTFTAQAANVKDLYGASGTTGKQVSWSQFLDGISFTGLLSNYCINSTPQILVGAPAGGTFSGPGISENTFDPKVAGVGSHIITYSKDGRSVSDTAKVDLAPSVSISPASVTLTCVTPTVSLTASSSTTGVNYRWSGPNSYSATGAVATTTESGIFTLTATSAGGCTSTASITVVGNASVPTASLISSGTLSCSTTSVTLTASGGSTYKFSSGATQVGSGPTATVSVAGVYSVTVTTSNGCTAVASTTVVNGQGLPTASISPSSATLTCASPTVSLTASGGVNYLWSTGATTPSILVSTTGTYSVTVTNASGCKAIASATVVGDQSLPVASIAGTQTICSGKSTTLTASGGTSYVWSNGATTPAISVSTAGTYSVTALNAAGCQSTTSVSVTVSTAPSVSISVAPSLTISAGQSTTLTASGGASYVWSNGASSPAISVSTAGTYSVTATSAAGCQATASAVVTLTTASGPLLIASVTPSQVVGCVGLTGVLSATASGGTAPYSYSWVAPEGVLLSATNTRVVSGTLTSAGVRSISVVVSSAGGGPTSSATISVTANALPGVSISASPSLTISAGQNTTLTASGGSTYRWSNGASSPAISVSVAGTYSVTATGAAGCQATASAVVSATTVTGPPLVVSVTPSQVVGCVGLTGVLSATASGGTAPYSYSWTTPEGVALSSTSSSAVSFSLTSAGVKSISVVVSSAGGGPTSTATISVTANALPSLSISASPSLTISAGQSTTLTASGGTTYQWSTGASSPAISVSIAGTYSVTATSAAGCQATASAVVSVTTASGPPLVVSVTPSQVVGCVGLTGVLSATASGGSAPYSYSWVAPEGVLLSATNTRVVSGTLTSAGVKSITVVVSSAGGGPISTTTISVTANALPSPSISASPSLTISAGQSTTLTASGGASYRWSNGASSPAISVSVAGTYSVTATSAAGCSATASAIVSVTTASVPPLVVSVTPSQVVGCVGLTGTLSATASGGSAPYSYSWVAPEGVLLSATNTRTVSGTLTSAGVKSISVVVSSAGSGPTSTATISVTATPGPTLSITGNLSLCAGQSTTLTAGGGSTYRWSNGASSPAISVSVAGTYSVTGVSASGCSSTTSVSVLVSPLPSVSISASPSLTISAGQSATLTASGGASYRWSNGASSPAISVSIAGTYSVTATSAAGCQATASAVVSVTVVTGPPLVVSVSPSQVVGCVGLTGVLSATASGGSAPYSYSWVAPEGVLLSATNTRVVSGTLTSAGVKSISAVVSSAGGGPVSTATISVTANPLPSLSISPTSGTLSCASPELSLTALGSAASYRWNTGATTPAISVRTAGTYSVTAISSSGCSTTASAVIEQKATNPVVVNVGVVGTLSCARPSLTLDAASLVSDPTQSYTYSFTGPDGVLVGSGSVRTVTVPGSYTVVITPARGCPFIRLATVTGTLTPPIINVSPASQTVCKGTDAVLSIQAQGASLTYEWFHNSFETGNKLSDDGSFKGTATNSLTVVATQRSDNYLVRVTGNCGLVERGPFAVTADNNCNGRKAALTTGDNSLQVSVNPNPLTDGHMQVVVKGAGGEALHLTLTNLQGLVLYEQRLPVAAPTETIQWSISNQSPGVYLLQATTPTQHQTVKVIR